MKDRTVEEVVTNVDQAVSCMAANGGRVRSCTGDAEKEIIVTYDDEPNKRFYTSLCNPCARDYLKTWDRVQIFGE